MTEPISRAGTRTAGDGLRILFVAPYVPSPIRVRPYQILRSLVAAGNRVSLVALDDGLAGESVRAELAELCESVDIIPVPKAQTALRCALALPTPTPLWAAYGRVPKMARVLQYRISSERFDVAHVEHLRASHAARALGNLPKVFDAVDCIAALQAQLFRQPGGLRGRLVAWEEWTKLRRFEPRAYGRFDRVAVTSAFDAQELSALGLPDARVISNGVDVEYFSPTNARPAPATLVFSGKMSYRANADAALYFAECVLPLIRERKPETRFVIAGSAPDSSVRALGERDKNIVVTGFVDDLRPYLSDAVAAVCPMRIGVGIQNKALEAMAMGKPAICSSIAARAIPGAVKVGAVLVADDPKEMASACLRWLDSADDARKAGRIARQFVEANHSWDGAAGRFRQLYDEARASRGIGASEG